MSKSNTGVDRSFDNFLLFELCYGWKKSILPSLRRVLGRYQYGGARSRQQHQVSNDWSNLLCCTTIIMLTRFKDNVS